MAETSLDIAMAELGYVQPYPDAFRKVVGAAISLERERCALIVAKWCDKPGLAVATCIVNDIYK